MWAILLCWCLIILLIAPASTFGFLPTTTTTTTTTTKRTLSPPTRQTSCSASSIRHTTARTASSRLHATRRPATTTTTTTPRIEIRDWKQGDGKAIYDLLASTAEEQYGSFNPEGGLELDCQTESLLSESYDVEDGGCFLVAELILEEEEEEKGDEESQDYSSSEQLPLVGTAGLIVGTQIQYQTSGSSVSSPAMTAAVRRCVVRLPALPLLSSSAAAEVLVSTESIQKQLLVAIEERAVRAKATQLISLAYPSPSPSSKSTTPSKQGAKKPTLETMQELGYKTLPQQLRGVDAVQCGKDLTTPNPTTTSNIQKSMGTSDGLKQQRTNMPSEEIPSTTSPSVLSEVAVLALLVGGLVLGATFLVGQFLGFDTSVSSIPLPGSASSTTSTVINRGLGRPLTTQDLSQLIQDERLQRTFLDDNGGGTSNPAKGNDGSSGSSSSRRISEDGREWEELSLEERREELALLQVIQGQTIRVK
jgi:hypothetical protein